MKLFSVFGAAIGILFIINVQHVLSQSGAAMPGLRDPVRVQRDDRGIPYIEAKNEYDLYFVQGYVVASDRLWQLDLLRRLARGETAEIFGRMTLEQDKRWRRFGFAKVATESLIKMGPEISLALRAYSDGVNAYISALPDDKLPREFQILRYKPRPWEPADSLVIGKILADALSSTYQRDLQRLAISGMPADKIADLTRTVTPFDVVLFGKDSKPAGRVSEVAPRQNDIDWSEQLFKDNELREASLRSVGLFAEDLAASNNWVISGKRTASGKPILANDPHLAPAAPGIWYMAHLSIPGVKAAGVTFPGTPGIVLGHNEHIAWGATNVGPDVQDLYAETISDGKAITPSGPKNVRTRIESIRFRANPADPSLSTEELSVTETDNGPIILSQGDRSYSLKWTALDPKNNEVEAFFLINRAKNWDEFRMALRSYGGPTQNFVYADAKGNIGWQVAGAIPIRRVGDGALPYDAGKTDGDWIGMIPFAELPFLYNPPEGFIMTANQRIVGTDYKYPQMSRDAAPPWRARRLYELISADAKATLDGSEAAQFDNLNIPLKMFAADLAGMNVLDEATLNALKKWDGRMSITSTTATYVNEVRNCFGETIANAFRPATAAAVRERVLYWAVRDRSSRWLPSTFKDYGELAKYCDAQTVEKLSKKYSADRETWNWGKEAASSFPHPLAQAPLIGTLFVTPKAGLNGSGQTPNVASYVSMRHIVSPGDWDKKRFVIPLGQSGDPSSKHFRDQFGAWSSGKTPIFPFTAAAVKASAVSDITYLPK
ncbi:MAG: penicillin acylase family protein [Acidobacteria bacterium]|nr:penicillin acylase family protein [Acidobacteriota bacterium]